MVAAALVIAGVGLLVGWLITGKGSEPEPPATAAATVTVTASAPSVDSAPPADYSPPAAPLGTAGATDTSPTPGVPPAYPPGSYILVLESMPIASYSYPEALAFTTGYRELTVVDSGTVPGLNPGYWAVVTTSAYPSARAARDACPQFGRTASGGCYPRQIG